MKIFLPPKLYFQVLLLHSFFSNLLSFRMQMILHPPPPALLSHHQTSSRSFSPREGLYLLTLPLTSNILLEESPNTLVLIHIRDHFHYTTSATCSSKVCKAYSPSRGLAHQNLLLFLLVLICYVSHYRENKPNLSLYGTKIGFSQW